MSAQGVFTRNKKVTLVQKEMSDVGDGKHHCMLVTIDQLEDLLYRVRDSKWVSGEAISNYTYDDFSVDYKVTFTSYDPPTEKVEWSLSTSTLLSAYTKRGWVGANNDSDPDRPMDAYSDNYFSPVTYLTTGGQNVGTPYSVAFREAIVERSMWANAFPLDDPRHAGYFESGETIVDYYMPPAPNDQFKTGFSFFGASWNDGDEGDIPPIYAPYHTINDSPAYSGSVELTFSGEVAWVDENGSGNPFDPLNKLYVGVLFVIRNYMFWDLTYTTPSHSTDLSKLATPSSKLADLKLKMSDGSYITAAIYGETDTGIQTALPTSTDWIFEATEWWPYAKRADPTAVWDTATGEKLPDEVVFAAFDREDQQDQVFNLI